MNCSKCGNSKIIHIMCMVEDVKEFEHLPDIVWCPQCKQVVESIHTIAQVRARLLTKSDISYHPDLCQGV